MAFFYGNIGRRKTMQTDPKTSGGKSDQSGGVDPEKEAAYWREQHAKQPYAKNYSYEEFEHAYRTGYDTFFKYPGKTFDEVEDSVAAYYEEAKPGSALPWDTVRPAAYAVRFERREIFPTATIVVVLRQTGHNQLLCPSRLSGSSRCAIDLT